MRKLKITKPLVFFDLETTGIDMKADQIIEIGGVRMEPDGKSWPFDFLIDPLVPIPSEITELTGITNDLVKGNPSLGERAPEIMEIFRGADVGGFNVMRFDFKFLAIALDRQGYELRDDTRRFIDAQVIFHRREPRDLTAAGLFYLGEKVKDEAHRARFDAQLSFRVLEGQLERYADLPDTVEGLADFCQEADGRYVDAGRRLFWKDGEAAFSFGKYRSWKIKDVPREYLRWMVSPSSEFDEDIKRIILDAMKGQFPVKKSVVPA